MSKLKKRISYEFHEMRNELPVFEYVLWWLLRIAMLTTGIVFIFTKAPYVRNLVFANTVATFAVPLLRFLSSRKFFTSKIPYRCQSYIDLFVFMGSFLGHGLEFFGTVNEWDKFMHVLTGGVMVFLGAEILRAFDGHENVSAGIKTFCGIGFSFIVIVLWELMEFFGDWFITNSTNQGYTLVADENNLFIKIFGFSKNWPQNAPVLDTNVDMFYAVLGCIVCAVIAFFVLKKQGEKYVLHEQKETAQKQEITV